jgi:hypothetical protein
MLRFMKEGHLLVLAARSRAALARVVVYLALCHAIIAVLHVHDNGTDLLLTALTRAGTPVGCGVTPHDAILHMPCAISLVGVNPLRAAFASAAAAAAAAAAGMLRLQTAPVEDALPSGSSVPRLAHACAALMEIICMASGRCRRGQHHAQALQQHSESGKRQHDQCIYCR